MRKWIMRARDVVMIVASFVFMWASLGLWRACAMMVLICAFVWAGMTLEKRLKV